ncbi:MAG TPA: BTAD domain-containing putative transcriptional regulator [Natronosporangium sp.]
MLALHAGQPVSAALLVDAVWGSAPPRAARNLLQGCVSRLRRRLSEAGAGPDTIITEPNGYRIGAHELDLTDFRRLVVQARAAAAAGNCAEARGLYRAGLELWRGTPLSGVESAVVRRAAVPLEEERMSALEECLQLELSAGHAGELIAELNRAVEQYPYREPLLGLLMLALYRAGRPADALAAYRRAAERFREELGVEPGEQLQELHRAILRRDPTIHPLPGAGSARAAADWPRPMELPAPVADFTGRTDALKALDDCLASSASIPAPLVISAVVGTAGVGKTALVVQWAHRVSHHFPDGQLYLDLRGFSFGSPLRPLDALTALLGSLGVPPDQVPRDEAQASARYRSRLAGRRVLVVLDNAASAEQVRPLLPGSPGCLVLVTSRDRLSGLVARDGARRLTLDVLTADEALTLLARLLGAERVDRERADAVELARACAFLPLAIRIAAAYLADRPREAIGDLVAKLTAGDRLSLMQVDDDEDSAVRAALEISYLRLPTEIRRMFRLLGLVPGEDFTIAAAAAIAGATTSAAGRLLDKLAGAHLIHEQSPGRFRFHDLLRLYARQVSEQEDSDGERDAAIQRLVRWYVRVAHAAVTLLYPTMLELPEPPAGPAGLPVEIDQPGDALAWLAAERVNLVAAVVYCAGNGLRALAWQLAACLRRYFAHSQHLLDWQTVAEAAVHATQEEGDWQARATARLSLADVLRWTVRLPAAIAQYAEALALCRRAGWTDGEVAVLVNAADAHQEFGQLEPASEYLTRALALCEQHGWPTGVVLNLLGHIDRARGRLADAVRRHSANLSGYIRAGNAIGEADTRAGLALAYLELGELEHARSHLRRALALHREVGDRYGVSSDLTSLATAECDAGNLPGALDLATQALAEAAGDPANSARALSTLAEVQLRLGLPQLAIGHYRDALEFARQLGSPQAEAVGLIGVASVQHHLGQYDSAADHARRALELAREAGYRILEGRALTVLAEISLSQEAPEPARDYAQLALRIHQEAGYRVGADRALKVLTATRPPRAGRAPARRSS